MMHGYNNADLRLLIMLILVVADLELLGTRSLKLKSSMTFTSPVRTYLRFEKVIMCDVGCFRLETRPPVSYREEGPKKRTRRSQDVEIRLREGDKPEVYTEEDQKLLGDCISPWELYVDGYDKNGKRIYDSEGGETCHQCRQKTLGLHTHCSKCGIVQGQFCGDCLYMRYGENVMEANQKDDWICPVCRGICNCSLCRKAKGWAPTGSLYRKVIKLGFKSVAHYLIQSRRAQPSSEGLVIENTISVNEPDERLDEDNLNEDEPYEDEEDNLVL